jgi:diadenosine tetraphosphate (Ap4A) HIT family hydrolase/ribosomal protein S18 acetylase RimI-like enzyme
VNDRLQDLEVRAAAPGDVHSLGAFLTTAWAHAGPGALGFAGATDEAIAELAEPDTLRGLIADGVTTILIAASGFVIVGFAAVRYVDDASAELAGIIVGPDHRGRGVGSTLVDAAFGVGRRIGATKLFVRTEPRNEPAIAFYETHGFSRVGPARVQVGPVTLDVVEMSADLAEAPDPPSTAVLRDVRCIFCRIVHGEAPASLAYEDDDLVAFMDLYPVTPGHLLVVPRDHRSDLAELPVELGARMFTVAQRLAAALRATALRAEGINLILSDGEIAMQEVPHAHLHVIPRFAGDGFRIYANRGASNPTRTVLDRQATMVREAMPTE